MVTLPTGLPGGRHSEGTGFAEGLEPLQDKQSPGIQPLKCERFPSNFDCNRLAHVKTRWSECALPWSPYLALPTPLINTRPGCL